jgi:hypothetical protein
MQNSVYDTRTFYTTFDRKYFKMLLRLSRSDRIATEKCLIKYPS